jgi:iron complex outermembrane receptor protein
LANNSVKILFLLAVLNYVHFGQDADSVKTYDLEEITIQSGLVLEPKSITLIETKQLEKSDAGSLTEIGRFIPSVKTQNNSRGESLFYLRGSSERQLTLFFDGVPLNIPWDQRIDLSLVPTDAVGEISVSKGIPSVVYGANTIAGVLNINSKTYSGNAAKLSAQLGDNGNQIYSGHLTGGSKNISYLLSGSYRNQDTFNLPGSFSSPDNPGDTRINSDLRSLGLFAKLEYNYSELSNINLSANMIESEKGVPPEIDVSNPRYWRYPKWQKYGLSVNGTHTFNSGLRSLLSYSFSAYKFNMQIDQYTDATYSQIDEVEKDDDIVLYGRLIYTKFINANSLIKLSGSLLNTTHDEQFASTDYATNTYSQNLFSAGLEYEYIKSNLTLIAGASIDGSEVNQADGAGTTDPLLDYSVNASLIYGIGSQASIQLNVGRKTRFPSLRESFSTGLGRFVINPDLKPEDAVSGEIGLSYNDEKFTSNLNFFAIFLHDGIVRETVSTASGTKFMRVNKEEIRTLGSEFDTYFNISETFGLNFHITYMNSFAKNAEGEFKDTLEYKPNFIAGLNADINLTSNLNLVAEFNYVGKEYGLQEGDLYFQELPDYLVTNLRINYSWRFSESMNLNTYIRANNLFDKLYYTQWGLPEAGRQFFIGASLDF